MCFKFSAGKVATWVASSCAGLWVRVLYFSSIRQKFRRPPRPHHSPVSIVLGCQSVAAAQLVRGSHSLGARKPRASQVAATRPSEPKTAAKKRWQPAASAWLPLTSPYKGWLPAREPRSPAWQPHAAERPGRFAFKWCGRAAVPVVANSPALTVERVRPSRWGNRAVSMSKSKVRRQSCSS